MLDGMAGPNVFKAACVQLRSGDDVSENIAATEKLVREASAQGASFIATPENTTLMAPDGGAKLARSFDEAHDPALHRFSALAKELNVWLLIGSLAIKVSDTKTANRSFLFAPDGTIAARYSKIHLFDVALASGEVYRESNTVAGGDQAVVANTGFGPIGLSICYDLRFPEIYRRLAFAGAQIVAVPSAFTFPTGEAHWEPLLRARAIENQAYVIAPAQFGPNIYGYIDYGNSMIVDPWGRVIARAADQEGVVVAPIDLEYQERVRRELPALKNVRLRTDRE
jgi:predicted amidohydrolase